MWTLVLLLGAAAAVTAEVPSAPCRVKSAEFDSCLLDAFRTNVPQFSQTGIKELGLPPLDPMYVPQLLVTYNGTEIQAKSSVRNSYTHGLRDIQFLSMKTNLEDPEKQVFEVDFYLPKVLVEGTYKTEGQLGSFALNGKGVYNISMTNVSSSARVEGHMVTLNGKQHLKIHKVNMRPDVGTMKIYATNLVNNNKELSTLALEVVNQFWRLFYQEMLPYAEQGFDEVLRGVINKYTLQVPYDQMWLVD